MRGVSIARFRIGVEMTNLTFGGCPTHALREHGPAQGESKQAMGANTAYVLKALVSRRPRPSYRVTADLGLALEPRRVGRHNQGSSPAKTAGIFAGFRRAA
jgi:hypothetical protein